MAFEDGHQILHFFLNDEMEPIEFVIDMDVLFPLLVDVLLASDYSIQSHFLIEVVDLVDTADELVLQDRVSWLELFLLLLKLYAEPDVVPSEN